MGFYHIPIFLFDRS